MRYIDKLQETIKEVEIKFSQPTQKYTNPQEFKLDKVVPLSDLTAALIFNRGSNTKTLLFAFHNGSTEGKWQYFFVRESHVLGLSRLKDAYDLVENHNFSKAYYAEKKDKANTYEATEKVEIDIDNLPF